MDPAKRAKVRAEASEQKSAMVKHELELARQKFNEMDSDANGVLDKTEVSKLCVWSLTSFLKSGDTLGAVSPEQQQAEVPLGQAAALGPVVVEKVSVALEAVGRAQR